MNVFSGIPDLGLALTESVPSAHALHAFDPGHVASVADGTSTGPIRPLLLGVLYNETQAGLILHLGPYSRLFPG